MTLPLFEPPPPDPRRAVLELVMAGRYAQLDDDPEAVACLSPEYTAATTNLADGHAETMRRLVASGEVRLGAPVSAWLDGTLRSAHLLIGPFTPLFTDKGVE